MNENLTYIDLFAGAGGLSEGFYQEGFKPIAHVEMDNYACLSIKTRAARYFLKENGMYDKYNNYLIGKISRDELYNLIPEEYINSVICSEINKSSIESIFSKIDSLLKNRKVSVIIGGPPCQAYSNIGRSRSSDNMASDKRNHLYEYYAEFLGRYSPDMFVFENVPGLLSADNGNYLKKMKEAFYNLGYESDFNKLNASNFGVVQNRRRIILLGWKKSLNLKYPEFEHVQQKLKIKDLFSDLPPLKPGENNPLVEYQCESNEYLQKSYIRNGNKFVTQHVTRPHREIDLEIYKIAIEKLLNNGEKLKYTDLPKHLITHKNKESFLDRFKVVNPDGCSHTMVAHISKDGHYYIYPDLNQVRSLSVREAARIQSFPDDFFFEGGRTAAFRQIGNAVPPLMAKVIANKLKELIKYGN